MKTRQAVAVTLEAVLPLSPLIKPFVTDIPKESPEMMMGSTRRFFLGGTASGRP